ncbi:hypothetical protein EYF80_019855 [Liparis tanakae]|uniref:Uncharacterized protein n=1 Tax=Liparis tanakae TaxID=230148 RepID=A0A4Z2HYG7_9TELE|nr:hypothetical protein EYF80_019855 [Liparis tanakae]
MAPGAPNGLFMSTIINITSSCSRPLETYAGSRQRRCVLEHGRAQKGLLSCQDLYESAGVSVTDSKLTARASVAPRESERRRDRLRD